MPAAYDAAYENQVADKEERKQLEQLQAEFQAEPLIAALIDSESYVINTKDEPVPKPKKKDPCHCGSGKQYKNCCRPEDSRRMKELKENT